MASRQEALDILSALLKVSGLDSNALILISKSEMRGDLEYQGKESPLAVPQTKVITWQAVGTLASGRWLACFASDFDGLTVKIRRRSGPI